MLKSFQVKNFKAIRDSNTINFTPLTVFIGNNGSGKSSIIEAFATYQMIVRDGLEKLEDLTKLNRCPTFIRFAEKVTGK